MPAFCALIKGRMILSALTRRKRIPINEKILTLTPEDTAEIHNPKGTKLKKINTMTKKLVGQVTVEEKNEIQMLFDQPSHRYLMKNNC